MVFATAETKMLYSIHCIVLEFLTVIGVKQTRQSRRNFTISTLHIDPAKGPTRTLLSHVLFTSALMHKARVLAFRLRPQCKLHPTKSSFN